jgi:hypothetical protein
MGACQYLIFLSSWGVEELVVPLAESFTGTKVIPQMGQLPGSS